MGLIREFIGSTNPCCRKRKLTDWPVPGRGAANSPGMVSAGGSACSAQRAPHSSPSGNGSLSRRAKVLHDVARLVAPKVSLEKPAPSAGLRECEAKASWSTAVSELTAAEPQATCQASRDLVGRGALCGATAPRCECPGAWTATLGLALGGRRHALGSWPRLSQHTSLTKATAVRSDVPQNFGVLA